MGLRLSLVWLFLATLLGSPPLQGQEIPIQSQVAAQQARTLRRWHAKVEKRGLESEDYERIVELLPQLVKPDPDAPVSNLELELLDLVVFGWDAGDLPGLELGPPERGLDLESRLREVAFAAWLRRAQEPDGAARLNKLLTEVLISKREHPALRRWAVLQLLDTERLGATRVALLRLARDEEDPLRRHVLWRLPTWPGEAMDLFLVQLLGKRWDVGDRPHPFNLILRRLRNEDQPLGERAQIALEERIAWLMLDTDWRNASRGIELSRGLDPMNAVPMLLDALSAWNRRELRGMGSRRIASDVQRELRRISGRRIGLDARAWVTWWVAVRQGRIPLHQDEEELKDRTSTGFFGLRPVSDRVTFVIDMSGSMEAGWGTRGHNRYVEAINQMMNYLQAAGEQVHFNVVLFNGRPLVASSQLLPATAENLEKIRASLLRRRPEGNTNLRPAIQLALGFRNGRLDPAEVEIDTVVVLCDGETATGSGWVVPFLDEIRAEVRVVFHCILMATDGDGTLEALSRETGGELLRVAG